MKDNGRLRVSIAGTAQACSGLRLPLLVAAVVIAFTVLPATAVPAESAGSTPGVVSHLLVLSDKSEDVSSPEAWAKTYIKPGMSDQEKALAIWRTVVRYRHQTNPPNEFLSPETNVHDPLKTIHVYGVGICCCASSNVCGLARYLDMKARGRAVNVHMISEVFYGGGWHMIDGSLMNYFFLPNGELASADAIHEAVVQWHEKHPGYRGDWGKLAQFAAGGNWRKAGPPLLATCPVFLDSGYNPAGVHGWHATMGEYDFKTAPEYEYWPSMGYQLNVQLREGEKLTRNWSNKGKFIDWVDADIAEGGKSILGLQRQLGDKAPGRLGNGVLEYHVPLASGAFRGGALAAENLAATGQDHAAPAVHVKDASQPGVLVLRMPSSYVYVAGTLAFKAVVPTGGSVVVSFSDNQGMDWKKIAIVESSGEQKIDLTMSVFRRYDYRLKFGLYGRGTGLESLDIVNDVQHSQAPLPTLTEGKNTIALAAGPQEGTITLEGNTDPAAAPWKQLSIKDFHPALNNAELRWARPRGKGDVTFKIPTPGDITRVRMNLGYRLRDANDSYTVLLSFNDGKTFEQAGRLTGPTAGYTKYLTFSDVPSGARKVLVKLEGKEANTVCLFGLRIDVDYKEPAGGFRPVKITYAWEENGQAKTNVHVATQPRETYEITCGPKTVVKSFAMELAK